MVGRVTTAAASPVSGHPWDRVTAAGRPWWIPGESPGGLGDPEIWADEAVIDMYARGDAAPAVTVSFPADRTGVSLLRAVVLFERPSGDTGAPVAYRIDCRRWGTVNDSYPYYVLRWTD
jgi:hypothetical protein